MKALFTVVVILVALWTVIEGIFKGENTLGVAVVLLLFGLWILAPFLKK